MARAAVYPHGGDRPRCGTCASSSRAGLTETIVAHVHRDEYNRTQVTCPKCDGVLRARERVCRTVETMVGPVPLERPYFYCRACHAGVYPLDEVLGVVPGRKQLDVQKAVATLVTEVPYDEAQTLFGASDWRARGQ